MFYAKIPLLVGGETKLGGIFCTAYGHSAVLRYACYVMFDKVKAAKLVDYYCCCGVDDQRQKRQCHCEPCRVKQQVVKASQPWVNFRRKAL